MKPSEGLGSCHPRFEVCSAGLWLACVLSCCRTRELLCGWRLELLESVEVYLVQLRFLRYSADCFKEHPCCGGWESFWVSHLSSRNK